MNLLKRIFTGLIVVVLLLAVAIWFLPAPMIKWGIETYGSRAAGGKIDVGEVDFAWYPAHLTLRQLQVTNPRQPMTNAVEITTLSTALDLPAIIDGKIYIDELLVEGIALDSARTSSGALPNAPAPDSSSDGFSLPALGLPDANEMVEKEKAIYASKIAEFNAGLKQRETQWQGTVDALPPQARLDEYKARWEQARKANVLENLKAADAIRKDLKKDIAALKTAQSELKTGYGQLQSDYASLRKLSSGSFDQMVQQLGLSDSMLANAGQALVNGKVKQWLDMGYGYYQLLAGGESSADSAAATATPAVVKTSPDFLIRRTHITGPFAQGNRVGEIEGEILNLSEAPALYPEPVSLDLNANGKELGKIVLKGNLDHRKAGAEKDSVSVKVANSMLSQFVLSQSPALGLSLDKALLNLDASGSVNQLSSLNLNLNSVFSQLVVNVSGSDANGDTVKALATALKGMDTLNIRGKASGALADPQLSLQSNLNEVMKAALSSAMKSKVSGLKASLQPKLDAALNQQLGPVQDKVTAMGSFSSIADGRLADFESVLSSFK